jgi:5-methylthioadenosine/S-adenosylhomocysteine deaminase
VNAHTHLELTDLRGRVSASDFPAWIRRVRQAKEAIDDTGFLRAALVGLEETWRFGTTAVADTGTSGATARALVRLGGRGVYYHEAISPQPAQCDEVFGQVAREVDALQREVGDAVAIGLSPHAPYTVSAELYARVGDYARSEQMPLAAHVAESRAEVDFLMSASGPFALAWRERGIELPETARSPVAYLERLGLLGPDLLAIHAVQVDDADVDVLADREVAIAVCPRSNERHGHGAAPLAKLLGKGISCGLGTDSAASVDSLDVLAEAEVVSKTGLEAEQVVRMLTVDGARAIGLDGEIGSIEAGKWADLCVVDLPGCSRMRPGALAVAVLEAGSSAIDSTYVAGRLVYEAVGR